MTTHRPDNTRRGEIITAATTLFARDGYELVSLNDVARAVGISKPTLYHYFTGKEQVLQLILLDSVKRHLGMLMELLEDGQNQSAGAKLFQALRSHIQLVLDNVEANAVWTTELAKLPQELDAEIKAKERRYWRGLYQLYERGVEEGALRDIDPRVAIATMLSSCNWLYRWAGRQHTSDVNVVDTLAGILLRGFFRQSWIDENVTDGTIGPGPKSIEL